MLDGVFEFRGSVQKEKGSQVALESGDVQVGLWVPLGAMDPSLEKGDLVRVVCDLSNWQGKTTVRVAQVVKVVPAVGKGA